MFICNLFTDPVKIRREDIKAMREFIKTVIVIMLVIFGCATGVHAWDVEYDANTGLFPTEASPVWQFNDYGAITTVLDGVLLINSSSGGASYCREEASIAAGVPVTMETQMCIFPSVSGAAGLTMGTYGAFVDVSIRPDCIVTTDRYYQSHVFWQDFTTFRKIRLAYDGIGEAYVWVDDQLAMSWDVRDWMPSTGYPVGVRFGSHSSTSYWQYVNYSKDFAPVPEPSSILALVGGIAGLGGFALRRRRS
jgi:hypothetical protein